MMAIHKVCNDHLTGVLYVELKGVKADYRGEARLCFCGPDDWWTRFESKAMWDDWSCFGPYFTCLQYTPPTPRRFLGKSRLYFDLLAKVALNYKAKHHEIPVMFIDGCDSLVNQRQYITSYICKRWRVYNPKLTSNEQVCKDAEIEDISDENDVMYLCDNEVPDDVRDWGRFV